MEKDIKKLRHSESEHKKEKKKCLDMLTESNAKIATLSTELATKNSIEEISEDNVGTQQFKYDNCDFNSSNSILIDAYLKFKHGSTNCHVCTACDMICSTNVELELHLVKEHEEEIDCFKCNAVFRKEADVYTHSNTSCGEIIPLNTCNKCDKDVVSKAALKKHMKSCKGKKQIPECENGVHCRWYKNNRCKFIHNHPKPNQNQRQQQPRQHQQRQHKNQPRQQPNQEWQTNQQRNKQPLWTCNFCFANIHSRVAGRNHICEAHPTKSVDQQLMERKRFGTTNISPQVVQSDKPQQWCKFQDRCFKGQTCGFRHISGDFLQEILQENRY